MNAHASRIPPSRLFKIPPIALAAALSALALSPASAQGTSAEIPLRKAVECTPRGGLPNFFAKVKAGKPVKVAYLGGSITEQKGWRVHSLKWLQERFPSAQIEQISAAIGGTGSDLGVFRLQKDVLQFRPDLLFVEFAVNDGAAPPDKIRKAMEGIVRQTWRAYPDCDICFVYTIVEASLPGLQAGNMGKSASVMEEVAEHYQIPGIHFGIEVAALAKEGKLRFSSPDARVEQVAGQALDESSQLPTDPEGRILFSKDGVHPYPDTGHVLYTRALIRALSAIEPLGTPGNHGLPAPILPDNWEKAHIEGFAGVAEIRKADPASSAGALGKQFETRMPGIVKMSPGDRVRFKFRGTTASLYALRGPDSGMLKITLDGKERTFTNFDKYCGYHRIVTIPIGENLENTEHSAEIGVLADPVSKGNILAGKGLEDWKNHPEKFAGTDFYSGAILVIGDLLPDTNAPSSPPDKG